MARSRIRLDHAGIGEVLKSAPVRLQIEGLGNTVAGALRSQPTVVRRGIADRVEVDSYTTDRAAVAVTLTHAAGVPMQAKHGVMTQSAGAAGLTVREKE